MKNLLKQIESVPDCSYADALYVQARLIEEMLQSAGAKPGKDYAIMDLFNLASPYVTKHYQGRRGQK